MSIVIPKGFRFAGVHCGVKPHTTKRDVGLIVSELPATAAGVYTQNLVCGAPVQLDRMRTPGEDFRAVVTNSGVANACTGEEGLQNARKMTDLAAQMLGIPEEKALVMSTGVIGVQLPMTRIEKGIQEAVAALESSIKGLMNANYAMMTTDTVPKCASQTITLSNGVPIVVAGICKGAAMIGPNMATMLAVVMTDAWLSPNEAQSILKTAADKTFNCISVEGHTSTSDTVLLLANGAACNEPLSEADRQLVAVTLEEVCRELAKMIPNDGEGITHLITIDVTGCDSEADAKLIAKTIANDALVKTAICGADPNWGRIVSAAGRTGVLFNPMNVSLKVNGFDLYRKGTPLEFDKKTVSDHIRNHRETHFELSLEEGTATARFWTSDLTQDYVRLNADYTT